MRATCAARERSCCIEYTRKRPQLIKQTRFWFFFSSSVRSDLLFNREAVVAIFLQVSVIKTLTL
jgi:hypothetical protein